ncbi:unnamed protein product [Albugo candida]|uniref:Uncharacterized protein n=1 Tax=Albugo candida TaxID=65357 RepID=A0A024GHK0_9STRA|nr:unnamed protein product [Albugo candida]|eukprot:CCI45823.1 unnamed protein product [Albugo candida]
MPFLFAYAVANSLVRFLATDRLLNVYPISQVLDLTFLNSRIQSVVSSINICLILYQYRSLLLPVGSLALYKKIPRNEGSVTLYANHLLKELDHDSYAFESVMAIYDAIGRSEIQ